MSMAHMQYYKAPLSTRLRAAACALALLIVSAALLSYFARFTSANTTPVVQPFSGAWQISDAKSNPLDEASYAAFEGMVMFCRELPAPPQPCGDAQIELRPCAGCRIVDVHMDGLRAHSSAPGMFSSDGSIIMPLPDAAARRIVMLAWHSAGHAGLPEAALICSAGAEAQTVAHAVAIACPAAAYAVLGASLIGMSLYGLSLGHSDMFIMAMGACSLMQSVCQFAPLARLLTPTHMDGHALALMRFTSVTAPLLLISLKMTYCRRAYLVLASIGALGTAAAQLGALASCPPAQWLFCLPMVALLACTFIECRRGSEWLGAFARAGAWLAALLALTAMLSAHWGGGTWQHVSDMAASAAPQFAGQLGMTARAVIILSGMTSAISIARGMAQHRGQLAALSLRSRLIDESAARTQQSAGELAALRHDMLHHLSAMQRLADAGEGEALSRYIGELTQTAASIPPLRYCAEPIVNAVLSSELERARLENIEVECSAQLPPSISLPESDICTVLANLLSNAIDAQRFAQSGQRRWLRVRLWLDEAGLYMEVANARFKPVRMDERTGLCLSSKPGAKHGLGLKSVQAVLKRHGSMLHISLPEGAFCASTLMPIEYT